MKPSRGICGVCGHSVAAPMLNAELRGQDRVWVHGHLFELGVLVRVRCEKHMENDDPRRGWDGGNSR